MIDDLYVHDPHVIGTKGLVFIGSQILVYRRDTNTDFFPLYLDLPGGGTEAGETPFETFCRELKEEFGLAIGPGHITYANRYPTIYQPGSYGYFLAAQLPESAAADIVFGDEGTEWMLMDIDEFMAHEDSWPVLKERVAHYLNYTLD